MRGASSFITVNVRDCLSLRNGGGSVESFDERSPNDKNRKILGLKRFVS